MIKYYCDICETEYKPDDLEISSYIYVLPTNFWKDKKPTGKEMKLCYSCTSKIKNFIKELNPGISFK